MRNLVCDRDTKFLLFLKKVAIVMLESCPKI